MSKRKKTFKVVALATGQPDANGNYYCAGIDWSKPGKGYSVMWNHQAAKALSLERPTPNCQMSSGSAATTATLGARRKVGASPARRSRLRNVAGFAYVPEPMPMRNNQRGIVYYLFFAAHKPVAARIVSHIFKKYRGRMA